MHEPSAEPHRSPWFPLVAVGGAVMAMLIYRATTQSMTHDEANGYLHFVSAGIRKAATHGSAANHPLNSIAMWFSSRVFGTGALALRLPALFGGLVYLIAAAAIARECSTRWARQVVLFALLVASPLLLDFLVAARGYGLGIGFFAAALWITVRAARLSSSTRSRVGLSIAVAVSTAAALSFAFANVALLLSHWRLAIRQHGTAAWLRTGLQLSFPGAFAFLLMSPATLRLHSTTLYHGSLDWWGTLDSLLRAGQPPQATATPGLNSGIVIAFAVLLMTTARWQRHLDPHRRSQWLVLLWSLGLTVGMHTAGLWIVGLKLPSGRTGLFLLPLVTLLCWMTLARRTRMRTVLSVVALATAITGFRHDHFAEWRYDSASRSVAQQLHELRPPAGSVCADWRLLPSLNYYGSQPGFELPKLGRAPLGGCSTFVVLPDSETNLLNAASKAERVASWSSGVSIRAAGR